MPTRREPIDVLYVAADRHAGERVVAALERESPRLSGTVARGADDAIDRLEQSPTTFGCVLAEYDLAGTTGLQVLRTVRDADDDLPVILLVDPSAVDQRVTNDALDHGVTDVARIRSGDGLDAPGLLANRVCNAADAARTAIDVDETTDRLDGLRTQPLVGTFLVQDGEIRTVNRTLANWFGYTPDELAGASLLALVTPEDRNRAIEILNRWQGETGPDGTDQVTITGVRRDGDPFDVVLAGRPTTVDGAPAIVGIARDLTGRTALEREVRRFRRIVEQAGHAIYFTTPDGTIEYVNPAFEAITGYPPEEAIGENPRLLESGEMDPEYYERLYETLSAGRVWEEEIVNRRRSGERYTAHQTIAPITASDGEVTAFVAVQTDVTERKRREAALERKNERLEEFASLVSHDLRNPLSVATASLDRVREATRNVNDAHDTHDHDDTAHDDHDHDDHDHDDTAHDDHDHDAHDHDDTAHDAHDHDDHDHDHDHDDHDHDAHDDTAHDDHDHDGHDHDHDHLAAIEESLDRMATIIDDVLTLARTGRDVTADELEPLDLDLVARKCSNGVDLQGVEVQVVVDRVVYADEGRLQQVFENLFRNAVEHGGRNASVVVGPLDDGFYVEDDGPGIPAERQACVFESGFSTTEDGTGLGLAIVEEVVDAHGWNVCVTSGIDGGARFEITGLETE
jgi:PAS domain S-box-containing protein